MTTAEAEMSAPPKPELSDQEKAAARIIKNASGWSVAAGAVPVPFLDMAALAGVQATMVSNISKVYGETISKEAARSVVAVLLGTLLPAGVAGSVLGSSSKAIPGIGWVVGTITMGGLGAAATYAIGRVFVRHFEAGGTFANFDASKVDEAELKEDMKAASNGDAAKG